MPNNQSLPLILKTHAPLPSTFFEETQVRRIRELCSLPCTLNRVGSYLRLTEDLRPREFQDALLAQRCFFVFEMG